MRPVGQIHNLDNGGDCWKNLLPKISKFSTPSSGWVPIFQKHPTPLVLAKTSQFPNAAFDKGDLGRSEDKDGQTRACWVL